MSKLLERIRRLENLRSEKGVGMEPAIQWPVIPGETQADELARFQMTHSGVNAELLTGSWLHDEPAPNVIFL
ncbi:MAG: hypothetical protein V4446_13600 [Pseudomonadota bacterium]